MKTTKLKKLFYSDFILVLLIIISGNNITQACYAQSKNEDYTSKVPRFIFDTILHNQELQLKNNPLILRFATSREKLKNDKYRPIYHFVNPEGKLNDPNGLCYWKGNWHLFYQAYPPEDPRQHWGHAISTDLVHWRDLPYAIYPNPEYQCFSGTTFVEKDRVIAMYHGTRAGNMVAISNDPLLLNWEKVTGKAVIPLNGPTDAPLPYTVFDPSIWKKDETYYSLSAGRSAKGPGGKWIRANHLFRSKDLAKWEYLHEFVKDDRFTLIGDDGACPYFWPIGDQHILAFFSHMSGGQYLLGEYDKQNDKFVATSHGKFNFGAAIPSGVHAPSAAPDGKDGVIIIFNMNPGKPTVGWNQIMTLPRKLTVIGKDTLGIEPAGNIESLRYNHKHLDSMELPANEEIIFKSINGNTMEIIAQIDVKDAPMIELNILRSPNKEEYTGISFFKERGFHQGRPYEVPRPANWKYKHQSMISLETSHSSILPDVLSRPPEIAPVLLNSEETLKLRIFIDKSVVEVFVNGKQCVAARVYPERNDSVGVSIRSQGKSSKLISLDAWQMKNIYEK
ncbi:glycosyl hydrolase family 32 domain protein [Confluentibacter flavum]|uniref:beta-fructofuranosidase n=2 Tax=Confluentibacter flavum TaxID=1909700 RepID=A0A2N3HKE4_9FLAO|nr:glycosyl hydrolase family 32 domain protein [Confluentibacter flavum]